MLCYPVSHVDVEAPLQLRAATDGHVLGTLSAPASLRSGFGDWRSYLGSMLGGDNSNGLPSNTPQVVLAAPAQPAAQVRVGRGHLAAAKVLSGGCSL